MHALARFASAADSIQFRLTDHRTVEIDRPVRIAVLDGRAWVTVAGEPDDRFLIVGGRIDLPAGRSSVIEADPCVTLAIEPALPGRDGTPLQRIGRLIRRTLAGST
jgi:hypothetical protein